MREIKIYKADDPELLKMIVHLLGNPEWNKEHDQALMRYSTKTFQVLCEDGQMLAMFSLNKNVIGDCHTDPKHRNEGCMKELLSAFQFKEGTSCITRNNIMKHILESMNFKAAGERGRFTVYKKVTA